MGSSGMFDCSVCASCGEMKCEGYRQWVCRECVYARQEFLVRYALRGTGWGLLLDVAVTGLIIHYTLDDFVA